MQSMKIRKKKLRPDWDEYFIGIAKAVASRATCLRRKYGAVITKNNIIVSTGYNGAPAGMRDCLDELWGATMYIAGSDNDKGECLSEPCMMCKRMILNSRIAKVVYSDGKNGFAVIDPKKWLRKRV